MFDEEMFDQNPTLLFSKVGLNCRFYCSDNAPVLLNSTLIAKGNKNSDIWMDD